LYLCSWVKLKYLNLNSLIKILICGIRDILLVSNILNYNKYIYVFFYDNINIYIYVYL